LESLLASSISTTIIVVDNASTDNTINILREKFSSVIILQQKENLGFGKANNIGISYALRQGADFVFLLNQDAFVEENTLEKLIDISKVNSDFGVLSPIQLNWDGDRIEHYFSRFMLKNNTFYSDYILGLNIKEVYEVPFVAAASWLIPKSTFSKVGGFDPIFKHYGEDNNYCQRLKCHQLKVGIVPNCFVHHDSKIRTEPENYIFSKAYYDNELKELQIKYADITKNFTNHDFNAVRKHIIKLIAINFFKFKFDYIKGYLKKYRIFEASFNKIKKSRKQNMLKGPHYLNS